MSRITANYDETWKEAVSLYLPSFLSFFFPQVYQLIDWTKTPESQEQEVRRITSSRKGNKYVTDKIFKVWLLQDPTKYFYLHIEIQCQYQANFSKRLYIYNYRIYNIDFHNVLSLVILGDNRPSWRPNSYQYEVLSNEVTLNFHSVKLLDYKLRWAELEKIKKAGGRRQKAGGIPINKFRGFIRTQYFSHYVSRNTCFCVLHK